MEVDKAADGGFTVLLDGRNLKSPARNPFAVQSEELAHVVATEWDMQGEEVKTHVMYVTGLCNTSIDEPMRLTKEQRIDNLMPFLETDTVLLHADTPDVFVDMQNEEWGPIVQRFNQRLGVELEPTYLLYPPPHPEQSLETVRQKLLSYTNWQLTGAEFAIEAARSLILGLELLDGSVNATQAAELSLLEQKFQTERFGEVEWHHGFSKADTVLRLSGAAIFTRLSMQAGQ